MIACDDKDLERFFVKLYDIAIVISVSNEHEYMGTQQTEDEQEALEAMKEGKEDMVSELKEQFLDATFSSESRLKKAEFIKACDTNASSFIFSPSEIRKALKMQC